MGVATRVKVLSGVGAVLLVKVKAKVRAEALVVELGDLTKRWLLEKR